jgi:RNA polymerase sigma factor (sigma-70 family)
MIPTQRGPDATLALFCEREQPKLIGVLSLYCGDRALAEELAQEALARTCLKWRRVRDMRSPEAWVHRVAINLANSYFRRRAAEMRAQRRSEYDQIRPVPPDSTDVLAVRRAISALPRRQRAALVLRYYADLPVAEVAELMQCPENTVKTLTRRALLALGESLKHEYVEEVSDAG